MEKSRKSIFDYMMKDADLSASAQVNCSTAFLLLQEAVADCIIAIDKIMKQPTSYERGRQLAEIIGRLQISLEDSKKP